MFQYLDSVWKHHVMLRFKTLSMIFLFPSRSKRMRVAAPTASHSSIFIHHFPWLTHVNSPCSHFPKGIWGCLLHGREVFSLPFRVPCSSPLGRSMRSRHLGTVHWIDAGDFSVFSTTGKDAPEFVKHRRPNWHSIQWQLVTGGQPWWLVPGCVVCLGFRGGAVLEDCHHGLPYGAHCGSASVQ